jgi:RHS repeat-associated protein
LTFDPENRLTEYRDDNQVLLMSAGYNGDGLRAWKEGDQGRTYFLYDGKKIVAELDAEGDMKSLTIWGLTGLLARNGAWYQYDLQGNVDHRLDATGKVLSTNLYDAWGNQLLGGDTGDPYGYKGQWGYYTDQETGLILCTYRYYDPPTGRFITRDPIEYAGGINLYRYVDNNVPNAVDPIGLWRGSNCFQMIRCRSTAQRIADQMWSWDHTHRGTPKGGDKLVHCMATCLIALEAGDDCAWLAARSTERDGNPFGRIAPSGDILDEKAALLGLRCAKEIRGGKWNAFKNDKQMACRAACTYHGGFHRFR